jgi:NADPH-dependent 2,4-dienoyl-CoA reductase/sulfur reductase-like enzyme
MNKQSWDVVVVGGGPAGIAAAVCAVESGALVLVVDDNPGLGGQIWRGEEQNPSIHEAQRWRERLVKSGAEILRGFRVIDQSAPGALVAEGFDSVKEIGYSRLILCTGARERFLPFPGWTLPNVMGAGGLQAMVKSGIPIEGKSVVVAGSGPLLLPVAAYLREHGAKVHLIAEQASRLAITRFSAALIRHPGKFLQAIALMRRLTGIPYRFDCWPVEARGSHKLGSVILHQGSQRVEVACDFLACGFHLVPNTELATLLGCEIHNGTARVDDQQQTSVPNVYCAGEPTGIGGVDLALVEGQIAGLSATGQDHEAKRLLPARARHRRFAAKLESAFALRDELRKIPQEDTLICRCEDVSVGAVKSCTNWREAKLYTRCGMGPCQGRICGAAAQFLFGWNIESIRPPIFAARLESLASTYQSGHAVPVS